MATTEDVRALSIPADPTDALVLVTGGAGFVGSHTADALLRAGYRVRVLDVLDTQVHGASGAFPAHLADAVERVHGDVRNAEDVAAALDGVTSVFHFASLTGVGQSMYDIAAYADVNVTGTAMLLETIVKRGQPIDKIVLSSSRAVYGEGSQRCEVCGIVTPAMRSREALEREQFSVSCPNCGRATEVVPTTEDRPSAPISVYGWTKQAQEDLFRYAADTFGLPTVILRYFNVYGSRQSLINPYTGIVSIFFSRLMADQPISIYEHGLPRRDFVHITDVVQANLRALRTDLSPGTTLNVGAGLDVSIYDVIDALGVGLGVTPRSEDRGEYRVGDIFACTADLSRTRELLGYEPTMSLIDGMAEFVRWARGEPSVDLYQAMVDELAGFGLFGGPHQVTDP